MAGHTKNCPFPAPDGLIGAFQQVTGKLKFKIKIIYLLIRHQHQYLDQMFKPSSPEIPDSDKF